MLLKKLWLYFNTIKHLKPQQVFYLLWYKFKKHFPIKELYKKYDKTIIKKLHFDDYELIYSERKFLGNNAFSFLNLQHQFSASIDWNFSKHGKLWNYNLQYFDFIFDERYSKEDYFPLIENCATSILNHTLKLEPYPVSLRLVNWLLFHSKTGYTSSSFEKAIKIQTAFLEKNVEVQLLGNHYFENLVALFVVALYFNNEKLLNKASKKLNEQLNEQILEDGAHYECSPMYHVILLSRLLLLYRLIQLNSFDIEIKHSLTKIISKMQAWLNVFCFDNGAYALFNDASNDIAISTKSIKCVFEKAALQHTSISLKESGYRKYSNNSFELIVDVGNVIPPYQPGHAHADMLSFCLNFRGEEIFIDPGVSTYEVNKQRLQERGTAFHNTVSINNENQSEVWASFRVAKRAKLFIEKEAENYCKAKHDGYFKKHNVVVCREFQLHERQLNITDEIIGNKQQKAVAHFILHPKLKATIIKDNTLELYNGLKMLFSSCFSLQLKTISIPDGYNKLVNTQMLEVIFYEKLFTEIIAD